MSAVDLRSCLAPQAPPHRFDEVRAALPSEAPEDWRSLAAVAALALGSKRVIGICGAQGSGKSTLAALMASAMEWVGRKTVACSLDDFYLTRSAREQLASKEHPLLITRGVPGTHDVDLAFRTVGSLAAGARVSVPRFDKGRDDRAPPGSWEIVRGARAVVFEGWCLGVTPQPESMLRAPVNELEAEEDPDTRWRTYVNDACRKYSPLWALVDWWIYLKAPEFDCVRRWRGEQERRLPAEQRMSEAQLDRFIAHYERLTQWDESRIRSRAEWILTLDRQRRVRAARTVVL